ncbi:CDP-diacylglycerol--glycerol-3-phosphate 3-phosphatidyltransferase [Clostridium tepidiprofundi DSM 19306]|uniref:CDP-diacylglycerol--serine O-phosphatidyltransferase n=1 Tax=Clostridium tepidiprofundi DSM 19306 TaxID=1121338 RepID=A0A151B459_9CLOT|nr:CDP-diacylglycerol--serine O-phosphatidyltransferase [Clostridium tepidiprofundi]KYH34698.1 CDP-diacylglycerol--glycerol-3-phosphate 3-phosphatidyltransferase [Clostridium tepidiprofundi DSM 19306]
MSFVRVYEENEQNKHNGHSLKMALPNIMTFANLFFGIVAILSASRLKNGTTLASIFILIAAVNDRFDGKVARKFNAESALGEQLDSLADLISFGLAPAFVAWSMQLSELKILGVFSVVVFVFAGAYRLARFNIAESKKYFVGMPITAAGVFLSVNNIFMSINHLTGYAGIKTVIIMLILSYCMVCNIKIKKM